MRTIVYFVVAALVLGGILVGVNSLRCLRNVDGETIGGTSIGTFGKYKSEVDAASGGCTDVILIDTDGVVVSDPDPDTRILPITGRLLQQPITVQQAGDEQTPGDVRKYFESGPWRINEQPGSNTTPIDELVSFDSAAYSVIEYQSLSCGQTGTANIGWNESGFTICLLYTSPSPRDQRGSRMPSSA